MKTGFERYVGVFLLAVVLVLISTPTAGKAQLLSIPTIQQMHRLAASPEFRTDVLKAWSNQDSLYARFDAVRKKVEQNESALKGKVFLGYSGDESKSTALRKVNTGVTLTQGTFPKELRVEMEINSVQKNGDLTQDSRFLVNYDYSFRPSFEVYAFGEAYTNSYLSIQTRGEIGVGARWQLLMFGELKPDEVDSRGSELGETESRSQELARLHSLLLGRRGVPRNIDDLFGALHVEDTRLRLGMALSVFEELEEASIESRVVFRDSSTTTSKFSLPSTSRYRFVLRPSLVARPHQRVRILGYAYFKLPLGSPQNAETFDNNKIVTRYDWRMDIDASARFALDSNQKAEIVLRYRRHYDNAPPFLRVIPSSVSEISRRVADSSHESVSLSLAVGW